MWSDGKHNRPTHDINNTDNIRSNIPNSTYDNTQPHTQPHTPRKTPPKYTIRILTPITPITRHMPGHGPAFQLAHQEHLITPVKRKQPADALVQPIRSGPGPQPQYHTLPSSSFSWSQPAHQEHLITPVKRKQPADALKQPTRTVPTRHSWYHALPSSSSSWSQPAPQEHLISPVNKRKLPADALEQPTHTVPHYHTPSQPVSLPTSTDHLDTQPVHMHTSSSTSSPHNLSPATGEGAVYKYSLPY